MGGKWRPLVVGVLALGLVVPAGPAVAKTKVENLDGGGARPACTLVGIEGDLDVDGAEPTGTAG